VSAPAVALQKVVEPTPRLRLMLVAAVICSVLTLPIAWNARGRVGPDGISYLDIASNTAQLSPQYLFTNGMWSPAFPGLLAVALKLVHPSLAAQPALAHGLDFLFCAAAYFCLAYFLYNLLRWVSLEHGPVFESMAGFGGIVALAYTCLLVGNTHPSLWDLGADKLLEGVVFLAAGMCIRLSLPRPRLIHHISLGLILAFAYTVKAAMFPISLGLLAILFVLPAAGEYGRKGAAIAAVSFLLAASPLIVILTHSKGRLTFGDAGRINYARSVNRSIPLVPLPLDFWAGRSPGSGLPLHPPQWVSTNPVILKFKGPFPATQAYWYDPTYWTDKLGVHFDVRQQWRRYLHSFGIGSRGGAFEGTDLVDLAGPWVPMFGGVAVFAILGLRMRNSYHALRKQIWLFLWPACAALIYASVFLTFRYLPAFIALGWTGMFVAAAVVMNNVTKAGKAAPVIMFAVAFTLLLGNYRAFVSPVRVLFIKTLPDSDLRLAGKLEGLGIRNGDELCVTGTNFSPFSYNYVRLLGARVTLILAEDSDTLAKLPHAQVQSVFDTLKANGAKAVLSAQRPAFDNDSGWVPIPEFGLFVRLLQ
jgi:hypothetical protein